MDKSYLKDLKIIKRNKKYIGTYKRSTSISKISKLIGKRSKFYRDRGYS